MLPNLWSFCTRLWGRLSRRVKTPLDTRDLDDDIREWPSEFSDPHRGHRCRLLGVGQKGCVREGTSVLGSLTVRDYYEE